MSVIRLITVISFENKLKSVDTRVAHQTATDSADFIDGDQSIDTESMVDSQENDVMIIIIQLLLKYY